jgi:hypothetical protein
MSDPGPKPKIELHRIRVDVLLWSLGGFETPEPSWNRGYGWDAEQLEELIRLVKAAPKNRSGRLMDGECERLRLRFGKSSVGAVTMAIQRLKGAGRLPWLCREKFGARWPRPDYDAIKRLALQLGLGRRLPRGAVAEIAAAVGRPQDHVTRALERLRRRGELPRKNGPVELSAPFARAA